MITTNASRNNNFSFLKQVVLASLLSSLSVILGYVERITIFKFPFFKYLIMDFLHVIPLLFIPLYCKKYLSFIGSFLSEAFRFFITRSFLYTYNPFASLSYAFCWGFLPGVFFTKKDYCFLKNYFIFSLIFIFYFFILLLNIIWVVPNSILPFGPLNFFFITTHFKLRKNPPFLLFLSFSYLYIKFLSFLICALITTYLYMKIKKEILILF